MTNGRYGPNTNLVEAVIKRTHALTPQEFVDLTIAFKMHNGLSTLKSQTKARNVVRSAATYANRVSAYDAAIADLAAIHPKVWCAATDAATVAVVADLVGQYDLNMRHMETLTAPWQTVIADVDPLKNTKPLIPLTQKLTSAIQQYHAILNDEGVGDPDDELGDRIRMLVLERNEYREMLETLQEAVRNAVNASRPISFRGVYTKYPHYRVLGAEFRQLRDALKRSNMPRLRRTLTEPTVFDEDAQ